MDFKCMILQDKVFITERNNYTDMLKELNVEDSYENKKDIFIKAKLIPENGDMFSGIDTWRINIEQDIFPEWYQEEFDKARALESMKIWSKKYIHVNESDLIINKGFHYLKDCKNINVKGKAKISVIGYSSVNASGNSTIYASNSSTVYAMDKSTVYARGKSTVYARGNSKVYAYFFSIVNASGYSKVYAMEKSTVEAMENCKLYAMNGSKVIAKNNSQVTALSGSQVTAFDNSEVIANYESKVIANDNSKITAMRGSEIILYDNSEINECNDIECFLRWDCLKLTLIKDLRKRKIDI